jgi:nucleoside-diphosphate-sugar epimerase
METEPEVTGPVNLGNPVEFTMMELAEAVLKLTDSRSKLVHKPLPAASRIPLGAALASREADLACG